MSELDDYEEGALVVSSTLPRKHWWQFWRPEEVALGRYTKVGGVYRVVVKGIPCVLYGKEGLE